MFQTIDDFHWTVILTKFSSVKPSLIITRLIQYFNNTYTYVFRNHYFTFYHKHVSSYTNDDRLRDLIQAVRIFCNNFWILILFSWFWKNDIKIIVLVCVLRQRHELLSGNFNGFRSLIYSVTLIFWTLLNRKIFIKKEVGHTHENVKKKVCI